MHIIHKNSVLLESELPITDAPNKLNMLKNVYVPTSEFYSRIIDSLQDYSVFTVDNELRINSWNSGATSIFHYEANEILGKPFKSIFTDEDIENDVPGMEIRTAISEGRAVDNRWHICKDGTKFYAYGLVFPLLSQDGTMMGFVKILRDLTESKKSEEAISKYINDLEELNEHKENILAILSHDLRSPLARIIAIADHLKSDYDNIHAEEVKLMLQHLYDASREELNMLDYLVEWARIKYASQAFTPEQIDLSVSVSKIFDILQQSANGKGISLVSSIAEGTFVYADNKMVLSIFQNIVSNAIQHSYNGSFIIVSATANDMEMVVEVNDKGPGMSEAVAKKLFIPQMDTLVNARKLNKGAGIGLLLAKSFLDKNEGRIWVKSIEGEGSSFYFSLPCNAPLLNAGDGEGA